MVFVKLHQHQHHHHHHLMMKCGSAHFSFELTPANYHAHAAKEVLGPFSSLQLCSICRVLSAHEKCPLASCRLSCFMADVELLILVSHTVLFPQFMYSRWDESGAKIVLQGIGWTLLALGKTWQEAVVIYCLLAPAEPVLWCNVLTKGFLMKCVHAGATALNPLSPPPSPPQPACLPV